MMTKPDLQFTTQMHNSLPHILFIVNGDNRFKDNNTFTADNKTLDLQSIWTYWICSLCCQNIFPIHDTDVQLRTEDVQLTIANVQFRTQHIYNWNGHIRFTVNSYTALWTNIKIKIYTMINHSHSEHIDGCPPSLHIQCNFNTPTHVRLCYTQIHTHHAHI